jgi:hypothetical protein
MFTKTKIALVLGIATSLCFGGLSLLGATPAQQAPHSPGRDIAGTYVDSSGNEHEITIVNGGWGYVDLIIYRSFELAPVKDGKAWQVKIFSGGKRITTTMLFAGEESAITEAKEIVDGIGRGQALAQR